MEFDGIVMVLGKTDKLVALTALKKDHILT